MTVENFKSLTLLYMAVWHNIIRVLVSLCMCMNQNSREPRVETFVFALLMVKTPQGAFKPHKDSVPAAL